MENGTTMKNEDEIEISLEEIFTILIKRLWIIVLCFVLCTAGTFIVNNYLIDEEYTASLSMYAAPNSQDADVMASLNELNYAQKVVNTYIEILKTDDFNEAVAKASDLGYSYEDLAKMVEINAVNNTEIFEVKVTTKDPEDSFVLANTIAWLAPQKIIKVKNADAVNVVDSVRMPAEPSAPNVIKNTAIGSLSGLILGVIIAFLLEMMDKRVKDEDDLMKHFDGPILGSIPEFEE